jgi:hypothetical protein
MRRRFVCRVSLTHGFRTETNEFISEATKYLQRRLLPSIPVSSRSGHPRKVSH